MTLVHRIATLLVLLLGVRADGQALRPLTLTKDLQIGAQALGAQRDVLVAFAPDGRIIVAPKFGGQAIIAFDSLGNRLPWKVPVGGRDAEILFPSRIGFIAGTATIWVTDNGFQQVALIDGNGKIVKSLEPPTWVHPTWAERRKYPVFANSQAFALYKDETMLLLPGRERALLDTPGYDRTSPHLLRTSWSGSIQRSVASVPDVQDRIVFHGKGCEHITVLPFGIHGSWGVSADGSRLVVATAGTSVADSGTIHVTAMNDHGDTVFSRVLAQPAVRMPQTAIDNLVSSQRACGSLSVEAVRDSVSRHITAFKSFLAGVHAGLDKTTWLALSAADTSSTLTLVGLDEHGQVLGTVIVPPNERPVGGDRGHVWTQGGGRGGRGPVTLTRYKIETTSAQPPRTGRGGKPSSQ